MKTNNIILIIISTTILLFTSHVIINNPDCPFHVDYVQYTKSINRFYDQGIIVDAINGKYLFIYFMSVLLIPVKLLGLNIFDGLVLVTALLQMIIVVLFYRYTNSILKTLLMATTLTFLTFIGHTETVMLGSVFLLLYFKYRDNKYSEYFIMIAALIRLDYAIYYLFSRNKWAIIPIGLTFLQWLSGTFFFKSDFGLNTELQSTLFIFFLSYGMHLLVFVRTAYPNKKFTKYDFICHVLIIIFLIVFLKFPSQKVFFFPVILSFMMYDFELKKSKKIFYSIVTVLIIINISIGFSTSINRLNNCTADSFYDFANKHEESIYFGVLQPYLDYYGKKSKPPYTEQITINCENNTNYLIAEDWRNGQLLYMPSKFCFEKYDGRYD